MLQRLALELQERRPRRLHARSVVAHRHLLLPLVAVEGLHRIGGAVAAVATFAADVAHVVALLALLRVGLQPPLVLGGRWRDRRGGLGVRDGGDVTLALLDHPVRDDVAGIAAGGVDLLAHVVVRGRDRDHVGVVREYLAAVRAEAIISVVLGHLVAVLLHLLQRATVVDAVQGGTEGAQATDVAVRLFALAHRRDFTPHLLAIFILPRHRLRRLKLRHVRLIVAHGGGVPVDHVLDLVDLLLRVDQRRQRILVRRQRMLLRLQRLVEYLVRRLVLEFR